MPTKTEIETYIAAEAGHFQAPTPFLIGIVTVDADGIVTTAP